MSIIPTVDAQHLVLRLCGNNNKTKQKQKLHPNFRSHPILMRYVSKIDLFCLKVKAGGTHLRELWDTSDRQMLLNDSGQTDGDTRAYIVPINRSEAVLSLKTQT